MKRHGFIAFSLSFCVSMFAIGVASNSFLRSENVEKELSIVPSKNIVLFLKSEALQASASPILGVEKIALSVDVPQEIKAEQVFEVEPAVVAEVFVEDALDVPLDYAAPIVKAEKIVENYEAFIEKPVAVNVGAPSLGDVAEFEDDLIYSGELTVVEKEVVQSESLVYSALEVIEEDVVVPLVNDSALVFGSGVIVEALDGSSKVAQAGGVSGVVEGQSAMLMPLLDSDNVVEVKNDSPWVEMKDVSVADGFADPWDVAEGVKYPKNKMILEKAEVKKPVVKNVIIPISEELAEDVGGVPSIVSEKKDEEEKVSLLKKIESEDAVVESGEKEGGGLLKNITSLFSKASDNAEKEIKKQITGVVEKVKNIEAEKKKILVRKNTHGILPAEIRLSFAPNRVEISGQAVRWLGAFVEKTKKENVVLEIRVDVSSDEGLQRRRLDMIYDILASKGVEPGAVKTVLTQRDANSFVVRTIKGSGLEKKEDESYKKYYQQW